MDLLSKFLICFIARHNTNSMEILTGNLDRPIFKLNLKERTSELTKIQLLCSREGTYRGKMCVQFTFGCALLKFFFNRYNLHVFEQKICSHQVLIYLNLPGIPAKKPFENRQLVEEQLDVWVLVVIFASLLTERHLLMNKKDKNNRYTNIKIIIIWRKT